MRVLLVNQDEIGRSVLGHRQTERMLKRGLLHQPGLTTQFVRLTPRSGLPRLLGARVPKLFDADLDLHATRWHFVEAHRARQLVEREARRFAPDVLHLHSHALGLRMSGVLARTPAVLSVDAPVRAWQAMDIWHERRAIADLAIAPVVRWEREALGAAALVLAWSEWARRELQATAPGTNVVVHHPGVDTEHFAPAPRRPRDRPRVLFVGSRFEQKGGYDLLAAVDDLLGRDLDLDLVTPHESPTRPGVTVHRLEADDPRLLELYQQADVLCLPTRGDASPWVILEAMACGTPVIASDVGGISDQLAAGRAGVLLGRGDRRALRAAVVALLDDPQRRQALAGRAREEILQRFDVRRQGDALGDMLRRLAERPGAGTVGGAP
jgi:glycosyltransferase involved in cell wall biosynthesis